MNDYSVPHASDDSEVSNDRYGAVAAVEFELVYGSNVPFVAINAHIKGGCAAERPSPKGDLM